MPSHHRTSRLALSGLTALMLAIVACGPGSNVEVGDAIGPPRTSTPTPAEAPAHSDPTGDADDKESPEDSEPAQDDAPRVLEEGDEGEAVLDLQQQLSDLGYWVGPVDGHFGHLTEQAVYAFQGWEGLTRDGRVGPRTRAALADATPPAPDQGGDLIEIHRHEQVLLVVRDGHTVLALHTSTGTGEPYSHPAGHEAVADTPRGEWQISWRVDGWRESGLGQLWRPVYFHRNGIAIHGYPEVPPYPASHGCARVSMQAMNMLWAEGLVPKGMRVVVT